MTTGTSTTASWPRTGARWSSSRRRASTPTGSRTLYPTLTGARILDFLGELSGGVDRRVRDELAERFDAPLDRPLRELSTGNRQKVGLVQAFRHEPEVLILDEPSAGLDPLVQRTFHDLLGEVAAADARRSSLVVLGASPPGMACLPLRGHRIRDSTGVTGPR